MTRKKNRAGTGSATWIVWACNPATFMLLVAFLSIPLWNRFHHRLDPAVHARVEVARLQVNTQPEWIIRDVVEAAVFDSRLDEIPLVQPDCLERVAAALQVQPWIRSISSIRKTARGIFAEVAWREPVGVVEFGDESLVPVDGEGIVLEGSGLSPQAARNYWRISVPDPITEGLATGEPWNDLRIGDAVAIAQYWNGRQRETGLMRIVNPGQPTSDRLRLSPFELWTASGFSVTWGSAPGRELQGEATADAKFAALEALLKEKGSLEHSGLSSIDVRDGTVRQADPKLAVQQSDFIRNLK